MSAFLKALSLRIFKKDTLPQLDLMPVYRTAQVVSMPLNDPEKDISSRGPGRSRWSMCTAESEQKYA